MNVDYFGKGVKAKAPTVDELRKATGEFLRTSSYSASKTNTGGLGDVKSHETICTELSSIYAKKNADYGDSFHKSFIDWGLPMAAIRLGDKYNRFCNLIKNPQNVNDESIRDTLIDLANYAIMTVMEIDSNGK